MTANESSFSVNVTINSNSYKLQYLGCWGGPWTTTPTDISENSSKKFTLADNDRGGIWYRALDPATDNELGFVTMSFTCPKLSNNSAEGSTGVATFVSSGLQTYEESGHPLNLTYNVGNANLACWSSGSSNDGDIECSETKFADERLQIILRNPNGYHLDFAGYWNDNSNRGSNWYWVPNPQDMPPPNCTRTIFLKDNDRAGLFIKVLDSSGKNELGFANMSFTNPKLSSVSAEGSPNNGQFLISAGLKHYEKDWVPYSVSYEIGQENSACWENGGEDDGKTVCDQTTFKDRRALIILNNKVPETLTFVKYWNDNNNGSSNWYVEPNSDDTIPPNCTRYFVLEDNDRAGLYYKVNYMEYHMSFTAPKLSSNSAEGSRHTGLQTYSESGTPVVFTYNVGTVNLACWKSGSSNNGKIVCKQTLILPLDLRRWMGKVNGLYPAFKNQSLRGLFIPGTHDAACYNNSSLATPWVQTQNLNFHDQLLKGVRYFDVRPSYNLDTLSGEYYHGFHHGPIPVAATLDNLISQITQFYTDDWEKRKYEIVILDFTHFNKYKQEDGSYQSFFNTLFKSTLNEYLIPAAGLGLTSTLNTLWNASTKGSVIASVNFDPSTYQNITNIWNGRNLFAPGWDGTAFWPDTSDQTELITFINKIFDNPPLPTNLWVLQDILTPGVTSSVYSLSAKAHEALLGPSGQKWKLGANIVIQDYYDESTTVEAIIENIRRLS